jgi:hypothetical protein
VSIKFVNPEALTSPDKYIEVLSKKESDDRYIEDTGYVPGTIKSIKFAEAAVGASMSVHVVNEIGEDAVQVYTFTPGAGMLVEYDKALKQILFTATGSIIYYWPRVPLNQLPMYTFTTDLPEKAKVGNLVVFGEMEVLGLVLEGDELSARVLCLCSKYASDRLGELDQAIQDEITARSAAIAEEVTNRNNAITTGIANARVLITAEIADAISVAITNARADWQKYTDDAIESEVTDRNEAISVAVADEATARDAAIGEAESRAKIDAQERATKALEDAKEYADTEAVPAAAELAKEYTDTVVGQEQIARAESVNNAISVASNDAATKAATAKTEAIAASHNEITDQKAIVDGELTTLHSTISTETDIKITSSETVMLQRTQALIEEAALGSYTMLASVQTYNDLPNPETLDGSKSYLCRVRADEVQAKNGVYRLLKNTTPFIWEMYTAQVVSLRSESAAYADFAEKTGLAEKAVLADAATALAAARSFQVDLAVVGTGSFNGTQNCIPGVKNVLKIANGGTGITNSNDVAQINVKGATSASLASALATARNIRLTGPISGNANFKGDANIEIPTTMRCPWETLYAGQNDNTATVTFSLPGYGAPQGVWGVYMSGDEYDPVCGAFFIARFGSKPLSLNWIWGGRNDVYVIKDNTIYFKGAGTRYQRGTRVYYTKFD